MSSPLLFSSEDPLRNAEFGLPTKRPFPAKEFESDHEPDS